MAYLNSIAHWWHIGSGMGAVVLGFAVMLLPKFGRRSVWHRWMGRVYVMMIASSCLLGGMLGYIRGNSYLTILGTVTLAVVVQGWFDARAAREATAIGQTALARRRLKWHVILMGASYIGAWSGFFANNRLLGDDHEWKMWFYGVGPTAIGAIFISRAVVRLKAV